MLSMEERSGGDRVDVQLAARDAHTRRLVAALGKRHKWLATDIRHAHLPWWRL